MDEAKKAIDKVFSDTTVSQEETVRRLKELRELIDEDLTCLKEDGVDVDNIV